MKLNRYCENDSSGEVKYFKNYGENSSIVLGIKKKIDKISGNRGTWKN